MTDLTEPAPRSPQPVTVSVVIPAHDEEGPLARTLEALVARQGSEVVEVIVAANGCTDRTVEVARAGGARVVEVDEASKAAALTAGDAAASTFPRIYLDADIVLEPGALETLAAALRRDDPVVAAPAVRFDVSRSSWLVRAFYAVYQEIPYIQEGLVGLGVYGLSEAGRARFRDFPLVMADDLFVQRLFDPHERLATDGHFVVAAPRDLRNLVKVRTRIARGNAQMITAAGAGEPAVRGAGAVDPSRYGRTTTSTIGALLRLVRTSPRMLPSVCVYVGVTLASRLLARRAGGSTWGRDLSTR